MASVKKKKLYYKKFDTTLVTLNNFASFESLRVHQTNLGTKMRKYQLQLGYYFKMYFSCEVMVNFVFSTTI